MINWFLTCRYFQQLEVYTHTTTELFFWDFRLPWFGVYFVGLPRFDVGFVCFLLGIVWELAYQIYIKAAHVHEFSFSNMTCMGYYQCNMTIWWKRVVFSLFFFPKRLKQQIHFSWCSLCGRKAFRPATNILVGCLQDSFPLQYCWRPRNPAVPNQLSICSIHPIIYDRLAHLFQQMIVGSFSTWIVDGRKPNFYFGHWAHLGWLSIQEFDELRRLNNLCCDLPASLKHPSPLVLVEGKSFTDGLATIFWHFYNPPHHWRFTLGFWEGSGSWQFLFWKGWDIGHFASMIDYRSL